MAEFGEELKKAREAKGYTQQTLGDKLYVTRQSVSRWESGDRFPDLLTLKRISQILEVSCDDLLSVNTMSEVVENTSIIENPVINNLLILLYSIVVFLEISLFISSFYFSSYTIYESSYIFLEAIIFIYLLLHLLKRCDTPKTFGIASIFHFIITAIFYSCFGYTNLNYLTILVVAIPFLLAGICSYFYFIKNQDIFISSLVIYFICILNILNSVSFLYNTTIVIYAGVGSYAINLTLNLFYILNIFIYIAFIYTVYVLNKRRKVAKQMIMNHQENI